MDSIPNPDPKRVAGIVLAAGQAARYRSPKILLCLPNGKLLIRHILEIVLSTDLSPIVVIAGQHFNQIKQSLEGLPLEVVINEHWKSGISTSLIRGLNALHGEVDGCLVILGDQPFISPELFQKLVDRYQRGDCQIVYPVVGQTRSNPVLFDRSTFPALCCLKGDVGGRAILADFQTAEVEWGDERLLMDIDTAEDFVRVIGKMAECENWNGVIPKQNCA